MFFRKDPNVQAFLEFVKQECKKHKVKLELRKVRYLKLDKTIKCGGYFDSEERRLVVATKNEDTWLPLLVHEFAHLTQWVDNCEPWAKGADGLFFVEEWLSGKKVRNIKKYLGQSRDLELDNEKRSVKLIKKWNLPIDIEDYIKRANAYVQFYNYMYYSRKWCKPGNSPYRNQAIYESMPSSFRMNYKKMSEKYVKIYKEQNI